MFKSRADVIEGQTGKKSVGKMIPVICACGSNKYTLYFDYAWCRYVILCDGCGERRSILVNNVEDDPGNFLAG